MTQKLYHDDPSLLQFDARVVDLAARGDGCEVVLDRTCFYPGGGGQPCDLGTLGEARVVHVEYRGEQILHRVEPALDPALLGSVLHGSVDGARRRDYMAQHTGQHLFSQALLRAGKLETVSVHFGDEDTTIELAADTVEDGTVRAAEDIANTVIKENRRVILHEIDQADASRFPLRRTPPDAGRLRIVEIEGFDWAACGGVHVASSGEIFLVKAVAQERIRGRVRIHAMIGRRAMEDYGRKIELAQGLSRALTCGESFILGRVQELLKNEKESARELRRVRVAQAAAEADAALAGAPRIGEALCVRRVFDAAGPEFLKSFADRVVAAPGRVAILIDQGPAGFQWIVAHSLAGRLDLTRIVPGLFGIAAAKGGGQGARMQGVGAKRDAVSAFADALEREITRGLG